MVLNPLDLEVLKSTWERAEPYPFVVIDDLVDAGRAREIAAAFPSFDVGSEQGRQFANLHEKEKVQVTDSELFPAPIAELHRALSTPEFLAQVAYITGIPDLLDDPTLCGGGIHMHRGGGGLDVHVDFNVLEPAKLHRRLNIIVYLNPEWHADWGGQFEIWDAEVRRCWHRVTPQLGRCMIFRTSETSFHGVSRVTGPADLVRKSLSGFYYTKAAPPWWTGVAHDTIYRARPGEHLKAAVQMPWNETKKKLSARKQAVKQRIKGWLGRG